MSQYIVSARKYRPDTFESLIGQDNISRTLKNSIQRGQIAHAYLFCGPRGVGKTSTARIFAKAINCSNPGPDFEPCGQCDSCLSFQEGRSFNIHEMDAASNNGVDDIRELLEKVQVPPQVGRYSVYIIDEVHMLSQSAFNAFLKTLEEPPAHAIFILATTEKHKILPTVLSRCQTYDFNRISIPDIVANLRSIATKENIVIDEESLHVIAQKADGAMRDALTIFDQTVAFCGTEVHYEDVLRNLNVLDYEYSFRLVDAFCQGDYASALLIFDEILTKGFNAQHFLSALSSHLRDLIVSKTASLASLLDLPESLKKRYAAQAESCSLQFLYEALTVLTQCEAGFKASANQRLHIEFSLMKLCFLKAVPQSVVKDNTPAASATAPSVSSAPKPATPATPPSALGPKSEPVQMQTVSPVKGDTMPEQLKPSPHEAAPGASVQPLSSSPRLRKAPVTLSMASFEDDQTQQPLREQSGPEQIPSDALVVEKWKEVAAEEQRPRLAVALSTAQLSLTEQEGYKVLTFTVTNESQRLWIAEKLLHSLEATMRQKVGSSLLRLAVEVAQYEEKEEIYMPMEKAKNLMETNAQVKSLVIDLGLDIK